jgi:hypothetical protein
MPSNSPSLLATTRSQFGSIARWPIIAVRGWLDPSMLPLLATPTISSRLPLLKLVLPKLLKLLPASSAVVLMARQPHHRPRLQPQLAPPRTAPCGLKWVPELACLLLPLPWDLLDAVGLFFNSNLSGHASECYVTPYEPTVLVQ